MAAIYALHSMAGLQTAAMGGRLSLAAGATLLLAGCGGASAADDRPPSDPALGEALAGQLMVDPALASQNQALAGMSGGGAASAGIPPEQTGPEAVAGAMAEATQLAGGTLRAAPPPLSGPERKQGVTAGQLAASLPGGRPCANALAYSAVWAARLPEALAIYPRGHVQEAAGVDREGCALRAVAFVTPVAVADVIDFYYTRATAAGYTAEHRSEGPDDVLAGARASASYELRIRKRDDGLTAVDLVTAGA